MLLCWYNLLVVRFPQVIVLQNWVRKDFAHEVLLLDPENFRCVKPKRSIPILQLSVE